MSSPLVVKRPDTSIELSVYAGESSEGPAHETLRCSSHVRSGRLYTLDQPPASEPKISVSAHYTGCALQVETEAPEGRTADVFWLYHSSCLAKSTSKTIAAEKFQAGLVTGTRTS